MTKAIVFWSIMKEYNAEPGPLYVALSGGFWLVTGLSIAWDLWRGKAWVWFATLGSAVGYGTWYWFNRLVLQEPHSNWLFALISTILFILFLSILFHRGVTHFLFKSPETLIHILQPLHKDTKIKPNEIRIALWYRTCVALRMCEKFLRRF